MFADEDRPKPKNRHEIGSDLSCLSTYKLDERITLLKEEIEPLQADKTTKTPSHTITEGFFKKK